MTIEEKIVSVMDLHVRPALQNHGGDGEFVAFDENTGDVSVRLSGSCGTCPFAQMTLRSLVLKTLQEHVPEVKSVSGV